MKIRALLPLIVGFYASSALAQYTVVSSPAEAHRGDAVMVTFSAAVGATGAAAPNAIANAGVTFAPSNMIKPLAFVNSSATAANFTFDVPDNLPLGTYSLSFTANGVLTTPTPVLRVTMAGPPKVTSIRPTEWFPDAHDRTLLIAGDNFSRVGNETRVQVGTTEFSPCVAGKTGRCIEVRPDGRAITVHDVPEEPGRQKITVTVGNGYSAEDVSVLISSVSRKKPIWIALGVLAAILVILAAVLLWGRGKKAIGSMLSRLVIDPQTQSYSLSAVQFYLWTIAAILGYAFLTVARCLVQQRFELPDVPEGLPGILAISAGTAVVAAGVDSDKTKGAGAPRPMLSDLLSTGGVIVPERVQFLVWTLVGWSAFLSLVLLSNPATIEDLPKVPMGMLYMMGISSLGYLGGKVVREPGPVIAAITPAPPNRLTITGRNLENTSTVSIDGIPVPAIDVTPADAEDRPGYSKTLSVPAPAAPPAGTKITIAVKNADGQKAEKQYP